MRKILSAVLSGILIFNYSLMNAQDGQLIKPISVDNLAILENIEVQEGDNPEENKVVFYLSQKAEYEVKEDKAKLIVILKNTLHNFSAKNVDVAGPLLKQVRSAQHEREPEKIVWAVLDLVREKAGYSIAEEDKQLILTLKKNGAEESAAKMEEESVIAPAGSVEKIKPKAQVPVKKAPVKKAVGNKAKASKAIRAKESAKAPKTEETKAAKVPTGILEDKQVVSLDFNEAEMQDVLRVLAIKSGTNIIYGDDVKGVITIHLSDVPINEALKIILNMKGLVSQQVGSNIVRVISIEALNQDRARAVTFTKVFYLRYASATDMKTQLDAIRSAEGRKGSISIDDRTNSLVVTDTSEGLEFNEQLINKLDVKPQQVVIEANIVEITHTDAMDLGIDWSYARSIDKSSNGQTTMIGIGKTKAHGDTFGTGEGVLATAGAVVSANAGGTGVAAPGTAIGNFALGIVTNHSILEATLSALVTKEKTRLISKPKIVTLNNETAKIHVGDSVPYVTTTVQVGVQTQTVNFVEVGIKLEVTPTINVDKKITLKLKPEVSTFRFAPGATAPIISTRTANTIVMVNNADTIVIGGLISDEDRSSAQKIPFLSDLPVLGRLFRQDQNSKTRNELLVFITPMIIEE
ncbi:MAG: type IV pilus secretin PilQ [Elusimicrobiota bacterium]